MKKLLALLALVSAGSLLYGMEPANFIIRAVGRPATPVCPSEISSDKVRVADAPPGWTPLVPESFPLNSAGVLINTGTGFAVQKGERYPTTNGYKNVFDNLKTTERNFSNWMACNYGANNDLSLVMRLPKGTNVCVVTYTKNRENGKDIVIICK